MFPMINYHFYNFLEKMKSHYRAIGSDFANGSEFVGV